MVLTASLLLLIFVSTGIAAKSDAGPCDQLMFDSNVIDCLSDFNRSMETSGYWERCPWPAVKRVYNKLKHCVDQLATGSRCRGHGFLLNKVFLKVHSTYFSGCSRVHDPPLTTLVLLIAPVIMATLLLPLLCFKLTTYNIEMPTSSGL